MIDLLIQETVEEARERRKRDRKVKLSKKHNDGAAAAAVEDIAVSTREEGKAVHKRSRRQVDDAVKSSKASGSESDEEGYNMTALYKEEKSKLKKMKRCV